MAQQLWGTYSVADHCTAYPFVADMVLYDRLLIPVPPADDYDEWKRWESKEWKPARQRLLLDELGDYVRRVPWTSHLREQWDRMAPSPKDAIDDVTEADKATAWMADDVEMTARGEREVRQKRQDPFGDTRRLIAKSEGSALLEGADARVLAVYAKPDRFDRHLRVTRRFPFLTRETTVQRSGDYDFLSADIQAQEQLARTHQLATLIVGQFVLPIAADEKTTEGDDALAREVLVKARDLLEDEKIAPKRRAFRAWIAAYEPLKLPDTRKVQEFDELLSDYNAAVLDKRRSSRVETAAVVLGTAAWGASMFVPGADKVGDAVGAIGTVATRYTQPSEWLPGDIAAAALIIEARNKIRGH
jgi:hypothetical protein